MDPCTKVVESFKCPYPGDERHRQVVFVDTPALHNDHTLWDLATKLKGWVDRCLFPSANWVTSPTNMSPPFSQAGEPKVAGVLYLHKITDPRMTEPPFTNLAAFESFCGDDAHQKVLITTTMWKKTEQEIEKHREEEIKRLTGARTTRFYNTSASAWAVVEELMRTEATV